MNTQFNFTIMFKARNKYFSIGKIIFSILITYCITSCIAFQSKNNSRQYIELNPSEDKLSGMVPLMGK